MKIELKELTIRDVVEDYEDNDEEGVFGYGGKLNIRPKYQREFVYPDPKRDEVIHTIMQGFPLNTMYWLRVEDGTYELLDGQQRTVSFCRYYDGVFSFDGKYFHNLTKDKQDAFLDYKLFIYVCEGTDSERLDWFRVINTAGEKLTDQELRNAVYTGAWLTDAKRKFSKTNCVADQMAGWMMNGSPIRQDYLQTALRWAAHKDGIDTLEEYMGIHQHDENANALWQYFRMIHTWVTGIFTEQSSLMKGLPWGIWYNEHKDDELDPDKVSARVSELLQDEDVTKKKGVYEYILTGDERCLSIRAFDKRDALAAYEKQGHKCVYCGEEFDIKDMQADHIIPWSKGGKTVPDNCQMLCRDCNLKKSNK